MRLFLVFVAVLMGIPSPGSSQQSESGALGVYADSLQGHGTASGEPYDRAALTAAHAGLPFGTVVRVANFQSGRMVDVRINDRKPRDSRILILSGAAARALEVPGNALAPGACLVVGQSSVGLGQVSHSSLPSAGTITPGAVPVVGSPLERKFKPFSGLFGKDAPSSGIPPVAAAPSGIAPTLGAPMQYGIPASRYSPPATSASSSSPFAFLGKTGSLFGAKPSVPSSTYPNPVPVSRIDPPAATAGTVIPMNAVSARAPVPGPAVPPATAMAPSASAPIASTPLTQASPNAPYRVQFGAFRRLDAAAELSGMLDGAGIPTSVFAAPGTGMNVVVTDAGFRTAEEAQRWVDFEGARRGWTERPVVIR
jgi:rare lipoprotein A